MDSDKKIHLFLLAAFAVIFAWSAIEPRDRFTWIMEVFPAILGLIALAVTYRSFKLTNLTYVLIWCHAVILLVGGHYTYAEMPLFNWIRDAFSLERNYYDRVGHLAQGFVPAIIAREILIRKSPLKPGKWIFFIVTCICLAISAFYEFIEWWAALLTGEAAEAFLGTQGDPWDTQWDMFLAMVGAMASQALLGKRHDRSLRESGLSAETTRLS